MFNPDHHANIVNAVNKKSSREACLTLNAVSKSYPQRGGDPVPVLDQISMQAEADEITVLIGPSGCGKSTLLRMVAGLEMPDRGDIRVGGARVVGPGRDRGMVFQAYSCFPWLTVQKNVEYGLKATGSSSDLHEGAAAHFLERVKLGKFAKAYPNELSGGMRQRVAIARALAAYPSLLLMDEPFGALDAETRWQMQELLLEIANKEKMTVLLVTHDVDEALFLGDQIIFLSRHPGTVKEVLRTDFKNQGRPATKEALYDMPGHREMERHIISLMRSEVG